MSPHGSRWVLLALLCSFLGSSQSLGQPLDTAWTKVVISQSNAATAESVRHWFLGYVEGKTDVTPPPFWAEAVTTFRLNRVEVRGEEMATFSFLTGEFDSPYHYSANLIAAPLDTEVTLNDADVRLQVGDFKIDFTDSELIKEIASTEGLSATVAEDRLYLALHGSGDSYHLHCIDTTSKKTLWSTEVEPLLHSFSLSGQHRHFVQVIVRDKVVYVFGASNVSAYIVQLDAATGKQKWRFTTDNYQNPFQISE